MGVSLPLFNEQIETSRRNCAAQSLFDAIFFRVRFEKRFSN